MIFRGFFAKVSNYIRGRSFEYRGIKIFKELGYDVVRTFGSGSIEQDPERRVIDYRAYLNGVMFYVQAKWSFSGCTTPKKHWSTLRLLVAYALRHGGLPLFQGVYNHQLYFQVLAECKLPDWVIGQLGKWLKNA